MEIFSQPQFTSAIPGIAAAYGGTEFWVENLSLGMNPDATWRALLVVGSLRDGRFVKPVRLLLNSPDSRVRAWACFALGQMKDKASVEHISRMKADPSGRVRVHARQTIRSIKGAEDDIQHASSAQVSTCEGLVLISEDDTTDQAILSLLCRSIGLKVHTASSERSTIESAQNLKPHAIITDNQKGKDNLSGLNMTWDLCRLPELRETIILMISADSVEPIFLWNGGDCFIKKPAATRDLQRMLSEYLCPPQ